MAESDKTGGFGSIPGDLFDNIITFFDTTPPLSATLEPFRHQTLVQLAKTEHAAANAVKDAYVVDIAFKCVSIQSAFVTAKDATLADPVRAAAMQNVVGILTSLQGLWV
jgi:hypothetical protein